MNVSENPIYYIVPDTPGGGIFSRAAIQEAVAEGFQREADQQNSVAAKRYNLSWTDYKNSRDANMGKMANVPEPPPEPTIRIVRDADGNPGWFVDPTPVTPIQTYVPPIYHQPDQLGTSLPVKNAPVGDPHPIGYSFVDVSGQWGPAGMTWTKVSRPTPFGAAIYYEGK
jgi:hypothetical protein